jgi:hypothetical protein
MNNITNLRPGRRQKHERAMKCVIEEKKNCCRMRSDELWKVIFGIFTEAFSDQDLQSKMVHYLVKVN